MYLSKRLAEEKKAWQAYLFSITFILTCLGSEQFGTTA
jgi:hypothetical protein